MHTLNKYTLPPILYYFTDEIWFGEDSLYKEIITWVFIKNSNMIQYAFENKLKVELY